MTGDRPGAGLPPSEQVAGPPPAGPAEAGLSPAAGQAPSAVGVAPADEALSADTATDGPPARHRKPRRLLYLTLPGCWGAIIFACLSFTPSLLPRGGLIQGVICGITAAIGYGLAVWAASIWRAFADRDARPARRWARLTFIISAVVLFAAAFAACTGGPRRCSAAGSGRAPPAGSAGSWSSVSLTS